jgi:hypothetical protein
LETDPLVRRLPGRRRFHAGPGPLRQTRAGARTELYNVKNDIGEQHDLAASNPEKVAALKSRLEAWRRETGAKQPTRNPEFNPKLWDKPPRRIGTPASA